jgi:hypothetical protein
MNIQDLLQNSSNNIKRISCKECGSFCNEDAKVCPNCGKLPRLLTLDEYGMKLPLGIVEKKDNKEILNKGFGLVPQISFLIEKKINQTWENLEARKQRSKETTSNENMRILHDHILGILANTVISVGGYDISKKDENDRLYIIQEMFLGDVFFMYFCLRINTFGRNVTVTDIKCPSCNRKFDGDINLGTVEISSIDKIEDLYLDVELEKGFEIMGKRVKKLTVKPIVWRAMKDMYGIRTAENLMNQVRASLVKMEGFEQTPPLMEEQFEQLTKPDMVILDQSLGQLNGGPKMNVSFGCNCGFEIEHSISWLYGNFFNRSYPFLQ